MGQTSVRQPSQETAASGSEIRRAEEVHAGERMKRVFRLFQGMTFRTQELMGDQTKAVRGQK